MHNHLFYIVGVQEVGDKVEFTLPVVEVSRWFYTL